MNWKCVNIKFLCPKQKRVLSKIRFLSTNIENSFVEKIPVIDNYRMNQIDLFAKDMGVFIDKVVGLVELKFETLDRKHKVTSVGTSSFHDEMCKGVLFFE